MTCVTGVNNQLLFDGTYTYSYDAEGNQTARWIASTTSPLETQPGDGDTNVTIYTWDNRDRLTSVTHYADSEALTGATPDQTVTYTYDAFDRWIGETITTIAGTTQTRYVYDGNQIVMQFDGIGTDALTASDVSHRYLWGAAVDQLMADEQVTNGPSQAGDVVWTLNNNENTVRDLATYDPGTRPTTVVNHRVFSAYGEMLSQTNPTTNTVAAVDCLFAYTGQPLDKATGLQNNGARWYDAITGRWLSQDPIGYRGGVNLYEYVGDSPITRSDPTGEVWWWPPDWFRPTPKPTPPPPAPEPEPVKTPLNPANYPPPTPLYPLPPNINGTLYPANVGPEGKQFHGANTPPTRGGPSCGTRTPLNPANYPPPTPLYPLPPNINGTLYPANVGPEGEQFPGANQPPERPQSCQRP